MDGARGEAVPARRLPLPLPRGGRRVPRRHRARVARRHPFRAGPPTSRDHHGRQSSVRLRPRPAHPGRARTRQGQARGAPQLVPRGPGEDPHGLRPVDRELPEARVRAQGPHGPLRPELSGDRDRRARAPPPHPRARDRKPGRAPAGGARRHRPRRVGDARVHRGPLQRRDRLRRPRGDRRGDPQDRPRGGGGPAATGPDRLGRCLRSPLHREPPRPGPRLPDERRGADLQLPPLAVRLRRALLRRT